jgi:hypothetical protein
MKSKHNNTFSRFAFRLVLFTLALSALASSHSLGLSLEDEMANSGCACSICDGAGCQPTSCRLYACPKTEEVKESKSCRKVNCEKVAVPAITLPWEQGGSPLTLLNCLKHFTCGRAESSRCTNCVECCAARGPDGVCCECGPRRCGAVRCVHVLEKEKYDVTKCETTWEVKCAPCCTQCPAPCCE